ncbi:MAG: PAS domain S-box protein [Chloroflexaceae bacterium]|nr:PAS domain S-box protein [Chloroflexaceae bacterium]
MIDNTPMMIWVTDPSGSCTYLSQSWYKFTGQGEAESLGFGWLEAVHPDDRALSRQVFLQANEGREGFRLEYRLRRHDGEYCWAIDLANPWFNQDSQFQGYIGSVVDISDRKQAEADLKESEARFRTLADNISQFAWMADAEGWIFWYNQRWFDYTGTTSEEMAGWGWQQVHHPDHVERVVRKFRQYIEKGEAWEDTFPLRSREGDYRWFLSRAIPIRDEAGKVSCWFGTNTDITELRQTAIALKQTSERLNLALKSAPLTLFTQDRQLRYTWIYNPTFDYQTEEVLGQRDSDLVAPESAALLTQLKQQVLETGRGLRQEVKVSKNEQTSYYDLTIDPIRDAQNAIVGIACAAVDISDRIRAEAARQESEERLRLALEAAQLGTFDWNLPTNELTWDAGCKAMFGLPPDATTNIDLFFTALHPEDRDRLQVIVDWSCNPASAATMKPNIG